MKNSIALMMLLECLCLWSYGCPPELQNACYSIDECVVGYVCDMETNQCIKCRNCKACKRASDCNDGDVCTDDICPKNQICKNEYNFAPCNDDQFCNGEEQCNGQGECVSEGDPCGAWVCDEQTDGCQDLEWASISAGSLHTCGIATNGKVFCWGSDEYGQLGDGKKGMGSQKPVPLDTGMSVGDIAFKQISSGGGFSCGITSEGELYCWGCDSSGSLGNGGDRQDSPIPVAVDTAAIEGSKTFVQISAGVDHACGVTSDAVGYCWGSDSKGKLGDGDEIENRQSPVLVDTSQISGVKKFLMVSAGNAHTCGLTIQGIVYCWGDGWFGQLGHGDEVLSSSVPIAVDTGSMEGEKSFVQISLGYQHTCGLTADGSAYCWGGNFYGQLGCKELIHRSFVPVAVDTSSFQSEKSFVKLESGYHHTCGITKSGKFYCWGIDFYGQIGDGGRLQNTKVPVLIENFNLPVGSSLVDLSLGGGHTCTISTNGRMYCWGSDIQGQLGDGGNPHFKWSPSRVDTSVIVGLKSFRYVASSGMSTCGLTSDKQVYCWGSDYSGVLGDGGTDMDYSLCPSVVDVSGIEGDKTFDHLAVGGNFACGITTEGLVYFWGCDEDGPFGEIVGTQRPALLDTSSILGAKMFKKITAGQQHACGITTDDVTYCWGDDTYGQLGDGGDSQSSSVPVPVDMGVVDGQKTFQSISAGWSHTCGLTVEGKAYCWGSDMAGELGEGLNNQNQQSPVLVDTSFITGETSFLRISAGYVFTCGITSDYNAYCWGSDLLGQLGNGAGSQNSPIPVLVETSMVKFVSIHAGHFHACALTDQGRAYCWGDNDSGKLGDGIGVDGHQYPGLVSTSRIDGNRAFYQIYAGDSTTCGITTEGVAYCWGRDLFGMLGDGGEPDVVQIPVLVDGTFYQIE